MLAKKAAPPKGDAAFLGGRQQDSMADLPLWGANRIVATSF